MTAESFRVYLKDIRKNLEAGDSTEHTHRPALKTFIQSLAPKITATNEPSHTKVGAPDFNVKCDKLLIGHIECKDMGVDLDAVLKTDQLKRYRKNLPNLILTDYINFIWFRNGKEIDHAHLARLDSKGKWKLDTEELPKLEQLLTNFLKVEPPEIGDPHQLAEEMARPAREIRETIIKIFENEKEGGPLHGLLQAFKEVLLPDLDPEKPEKFADMYAQTIAYGLFAAKTDEEEIGLEPDKFTWEHAFHHLPKSNPFLQSLFSRMMSPDNREPRIIPWVEELTALLGRSDMRSIKKDFGKKTRQEDPVVHFYETFLGAYDPAMKKSRGIYYTPQPVVSYIVHSIDWLLKEKFNIKKGLADDTMIKIKVKDKEGNIVEEEVPKVQILDPACGTGSFLLEVMKLIYERVGAAKWNSYVRKYLLPRLFGFELLVAPYTIAHLKLGLYLKETGFEFGTDERLGIYLTNTLEPEVHGQLGFARIIAEEGKRAQKVKKEEPIMVVLGNPPYSYQSANTGEWISGLIRDYYQVDGQSLGERNPRGLQDDYVKFLRFAQWRIEQTGYGIVGMITNHAYLDNPTFRGMRQQLINAFSELYVLDLHGSTKKKEVCLDGSKDENVFDIQQGVAIGLFVKEEDKKTTKVKHSELWGLREVKYAHLAGAEVKTIEKEKLTPTAPFYLFIPQDIELLTEYEKGRKIIDIMPINSVGIVTSRDHLAVHMTQEEAKRILRQFLSLPPEDAREQLELGRDSLEWRVSWAQNDLKQVGVSESLTKMAYRPFDVRLTCFTGNSKGFHGRPRTSVMQHMFEYNLALLTSRMTKGETFAHAHVTRFISEKILLSPKTSNNSFHFPLYLYPTPKQTGQQGLHKEESETRKPNLAPEFINQLEKKLKLTFILDGQGDLKKTFGPQDVFYYIYAVLHSPIYRSRYAEFLKIDFPRVPLTSSKPLFRKLVTKGKALTELHLMESAKLADPSTSGVDLNPHPELKNEVVKVSYNEKHKRVYINKAQYFEGVEPKVWNFHVGGYQVCHKWLKDRKGRRLNYDDITLYQKIVIALRETIKLMDEIDKAIPSWPIE